MSDRTISVAAEPPTVRARDPILDLSEALLDAGVEHKIKAVPCEDDTPLYSIEGIVRFASVGAFAAACQSVGFDAVYSAGSGWTFVTSRAEYQRRSDEAFTALTTDDSAASSPDSNPDE